MAVFLKCARVVEVEDQRRQLSISSRLQSLEKSCVKILGKVASVLLDRFQQEVRDSLNLQKSDCGLWQSFRGDLGRFQNSNEILQRSCVVVSPQQASFLEFLVAQRLFDAVHNAQKSLGTKHKTVPSGAHFQFELQGTLWTWGQFFAFLWSRLCSFQRLVEW